MYIFKRFTLPCGCNVKDSVVCAEHAERRTATTWPDLIDAHLDYDYSRPQLQDTLSGHWDDQIVLKQGRTYKTRSLLSHKNMRTGAGGTERVRVHENTPVRRDA